MTREERRALLGDAVIERIHQDVAEAVAETRELTNVAGGPELISRLRLILAPAAARLQARKAAEVSAAAAEAA